MSSSPTSLGQILQGRVLGASPGEELVGLAESVTGVLVAVGVQQTSRAVLALRGPGDGLEESLPWVLAVAFSFTGLLTMGLTLLTMTLLGRWAGSIAGPLLVTSLWWVQGVDRARFWVPLHDSADLRYWPVLASLLVAPGGVRLSAKRATRRLSA